MDIDEEKRWKEVFTTETKCDFCQRSVSRIARVIIHPIWKMGESTAEFDAAIMAKKCWKCCEE